MSKDVRVTFKSGHVYDIPATVIAEDRASYYAERDTGDSDGDACRAVFEAEVEFALGNELELRDWLLNNMYWTDVKEDAELVKTPSFTSEEEWPNPDDVSLVIQ